MIDWAKMNTTKDEHAAIVQVAKHAIQHGVTRDMMSLVMDLEATHSKVPLRLTDMLAPGAVGEMLHDVCGIIRHLNRDTGELGDCFSPRFAA